MSHGRVAFKDAENGVFGPLSPYGRHATSL